LRTWSRKELGTLKDGEYRVLGLLEGGQTNCALESGCPFSAKLNGAFDQESNTITGKVQDAVIDYTAVIVLAAGDFSGELTGGDTFVGEWSGQMTDVVILLPALEGLLGWVDASGSGTWEATADE